MIKLIIILFLMLIGVLFSCAYGVVHDIVTYSISPEFYTLVRFKLWQIPESASYWGAAQIGVFNTWRIGFLVSLVIASSAIIHSNVYRMIRITLESYLIAMVVTIICSTMGFFAGYLDKAGIEILIDAVHDKQQFIQVQTMHNFTYLGSILGMLAALFWHFYRRKIHRF